jgi:hypothetical protein
VTARRSEEDSSGWYISWRMSEFTGKFILNDAEFRSLSSLYPLVTQIRRGRYYCTCTCSADVESMNWAIAAIRNYQLHSEIDN